MSPSVCKCTHVRIEHKDGRRCSHRACGCVVFRERTS